ncbi:MAG: RNA 2',3'-cyclic phosphodiesterase [Rhodospirillales bacterium]|nr:RNA 2',3'-cyclic phosphodiesterase [Rhodospirillales bacterium]
MVRLFVGLTLPQTHRQRLSLLGHGIEGARWVAPENLHLTLRFIGEVDEHVGEAVAEALNGVNGKPFGVTLHGLGTFGHPPHALWVGAEDAPSGALAALNGAVESVLVRQGLEPEHRKFAPHVTLARFRKASVNRLVQFLEINGALALEPFEVAGFTLFQSHLRPEGAEYERIVEYTFVG